MEDNLMEAKTRPYEYWSYEIDFVGSGCSRILRLSLDRVLF